MYNLWNEMGIFEIEEQYFALFKFVAFSITKG